MGQNGIRDYNSGSPGRKDEVVRLDSWKEIASYLHRDARTVRRWERERRLPVHRVPGGERSGVFAYVAELEQWLRAKDVPPESSAVETVLDSESSISLNPVPDDVSAGEISVISTSLLDGNDLGRRASAPMAVVHSVSVAQVQSFATGDSHSPVSAERRRQSDQQAALTGGESSAILQSESSRWAVLAMAVLLIFSVAAGATFAFVHYRRFHLANAEPSGPSPEAQELYLRGRYSWNLRTEQGLNQAIDLFTQSIVTDPHYAPAYAGLADSYLLLRQYGHMSDAEAYPRALAAVRQAVALDANSPDAHRSLAFILCFWSWDMPSAEREYLRAIELDPKSSLSHHWYATALLSAGRFKEALAQINLARTLEPQSVSVLADRGLILSFEDPAQAIEALKQVVQSQPEFVSAHTYLSKIYLGQGNYAGFLTEDGIVAGLAHDEAKIQVLERARKDLDSHGPQLMLRNLAAEYARFTERGQVPAYATARLFGLAGDAAQAIHFLQIACDRRDPGFLSVASDGAFRHVRSSPEYIALIAHKESLQEARREPIARLDSKSPF